MIYIYKNLDRTSQEIHYVSATETDLLLVFGERVAGHCGNNAEHTGAFCGENTEFQCAKQAVYADCPKSKGQYVGRSQYLLFYAQICLCVQFRTVTNGELLHCTDEQHGRSPQVLRSALMLTAELLKIHYTT
jgi:hypothetical protein